MGLFLYIYLSSMNNIILFDDDKWKDLLPLCLTRPIADLRIGILKISEKWEHHLNGKVSYITQDYLSKKFPINISSDNLVINSRCLPNPKVITLIKSLEKNDALLHGDNLVAARMDNTQFQRLIDNEDIEELKGVDIQNISKEFDVISRPQDIFLKNADEIKKDFNVLDTSHSIKLDESVSVIGDNPIYVAPGAKLRHCILNTESGPIYIAKNATVMEGSILRGPLFLGENSIVKMGAKIYADCSFGPYCKIAGEISNSVMQGYSNKGHDGYLGNSVLGEWCNLGAGTNISNLKNNYAEVKLWNYSTQKFEHTGSPFCGLIMGDHSKCGINMMFNTGTVVGVGANIFGSGYPRNYIPSFSWGGAHGYKTFQLDKAMELADIVMQRRGLSLDDENKLILEHVFRASSSSRNWES